MRTRWSFPSGTTLNLNGLNLYVRDAQIGGTVTGGSITQIPNSGPLALDSPTPGDTLRRRGELDHWTFFDRGGDSLTVTLDLGQRSGRWSHLALSPMGSGPLLNPSNDVLHVDRQHGQRDPDV